MNHNDGTMVPIWTLSTTEGAGVPSFMADDGLTPERLTELRTALAALPARRERSAGLTQAVEAGQSDETNPFGHFVQSLKDDQQKIDELEARVHRTLLRLSSLELRSPKRLLDKVMTRKQVENLLDTSYRLRALAPRYIASAQGTDVVIEIEKHSDGTLLVLPSRAS